MRLARILFAILVGLAFAGVAWEIAAQATTTVVKPCAGCCTNDVPHACLPKHDPFITLYAGKGTKHPIGYISCKRESYNASLAEYRFNGCGRFVVAGKG